MGVFVIPRARGHSLFAAFFVILTRRFCPRSRRILCAECHSDILRFAQCLQGSARHSGRFSARYVPTSFREWCADSHTTKTEKFTEKCRVAAITIFRKEMAMAANGTLTDHDRLERLAWLLQGVMERIEKDANAACYHGNHYGILSSEPLAKASWHGRPAHETRARCPCHVCLQGFCKRLIALSSTMAIGDVLLRKSVLRYRQNRIRQSAQSSRVPFRR